MGQDHRTDLNGREKFGHGFLSVFMDCQGASYWSGGRPGDEGGVVFHNLRYRPVMTATFPFNLPAVVPANVCIFFMFAITSTSVLLFRIIEQLDYLVKL